MCCHITYDECECKASMEHEVTEKVGDQGQGSEGQVKECSHRVPIMGFSQFYS